MCPFFVALRVLVILTAGAVGCLLLIALVGWQFALLVVVCGALAGPLDRRWRDAQQRQGAPRAALPAVPSPPATARARGTVEIIITVKGARVTAIEERG